MTVRADPSFLHTYQSALAGWDGARSTERVWAKDATVWSSSSEASWLGWLDAATTDDAELNALAEELRVATAPGTTDILLIGMGGSSLGAEVVARVLGARPGSRTLHILDSTEPAYVRDVLARTHWNSTAVVVASKSGSTLEPDILLSAALDAARHALGDDGAARRFIAITDPGSKLAAQASGLDFAGVIHGEPSIGGRYSVLSPFGLVPAALSGLNLVAFMESARAMSAQCHRDAKDNAAVQLGVFMGCAALAGRDKCTLVLPHALASLGAWIEQLIAESTGKNGVAVLPIDGESLGAPGVYGDDRAFVRVRMTGDADDGRVNALVSAGHPVFTLDVSGADALAGEFFRWQFATAVAGAMLHINPFDQPDVESAKIATRALTDVIEHGGTPPTPPPETTTVKDVLASVRPGDYVALLAFLPMFPNVVEAMQRTRARIRDARRVATSVGFGPRFLHSTGQAFKGGPATGVFIQLTADTPDDLPIPGRKLTFGAVIAAQAAGDRQVLRDRHRRVVHVHLNGALTDALEHFDREVAAALA